MRRIQARARELFGDAVPLPPATQHAAFNGRYVSLDKLIALVRTLMSWDPYGQPCPAPDRTHPDLAPWHEQWRAIAELRSSRHRPAPARTSADEPAPAQPPAPAPAPVDLQSAEPDGSQDRPREPEPESESEPKPEPEPEAAAVPAPPPAGPDHVTARVLAKAGRTLAAMSLAGVLILALDASSPHVCTAAYTATPATPATQYSLATEYDRQAQHPALRAGVRQRPALRPGVRPGMCVYYVGRTGCPADFPQPTPTTAPPPSPDLYPNPNPNPYPSPSPSPDLSPSPDPSPSVTLTPKPKPTHKQNVCA
ncbi:hypothetical protein ACFW9L_02365 [Streptomyces sp. NPDC059517]|uniref:hypothetical protein n=1 Tax=Streptomyces sp. NPDC059517 TaxID=3346855 RepID=UPI003681FC7E